MKDFLLRKTREQSIGRSWPRVLLGLFSLLLIGASSTPLLAEGSKDFVENDPQGKRLFLDTRNDQQLKVFVNGGETINVGASHVGLAGGYIIVIDPFGNPVDTFNTGQDSIAIIYNHIQEGNGPVGGGIGYKPGTVTVDNSLAGIWTIIFGFPDEESTASIGELDNQDAWDRATHQTPANEYAILSWDITVTTNGAGNAGGTPVEGRVYSNEYITVLDANNLSTSPLFYVLTEDGFLYEVDVQNADPFRFRIFSNSFGLVDGNLNPIYHSEHRDNYRKGTDVLTWDPDSIYFYNPQAQGVGGLTNNKVFFNLPDTTMPASDTVTDVFRDNTHEIWLYNSVDTFVLDTSYFSGLDIDGVPCAPGTIEFEKGGFFYFNSNQGGSVTLELDFPPPYVDLVITDVLSNGLDSVFWDGFDGAGNPIAIEDDFTFTYQGTIRYGEVHIGLEDVEGNPGGVTFTWLNAAFGEPDSLFYYDHSGLGIQNTTSDIVSGGGTSGNAMPTSEPFQYPLAEGNRLYLDQWFFIENDISPDSVTVDVVLECVCANREPEITVEGGACVGGSLVLTAFNTADSVGQLMYSFMGPSGFVFMDTVGEMETSIAVVTTNATAANEGTYTVIATSDLGCADTVDLDVTLNLLPNISAIIGGGDYCAGDDLTLTTANITAGLTDTTFYTWITPTDTVEGFVIGNADIILTVNNLTAADSGTYSISMTANSCLGGPFSTQVGVNPTPVLSADDPDVDICTGGDVQLCATNSTPGIGDMICTWMGPNGFFSQATVSGDSICIDLTAVDETFDGVYSVFCDFEGCISNTVEINLDVQPTPVITGISPTGEFCVGDDVTFTAQNNVPGTGDLDYCWIGPSGDTLFQGTGPELGPFPYTLENVQLSDSGTYVLILKTSAGCESVPQTTTIEVIPAPETCNVTGGGDACVGQDVTLSAFNCAEDVLPVEWTWTGPGGVTIGSGTSSENGPYEVTLTNVQVGDSGEYCVTIESTVNGCVSEQLCVDLNVLPGLNVVDITPDSTYCPRTDVLLTGMSTLGSGTITYTWTGPDGTTFCGPIPVSFDEPLSCTIFDLSPADTGIYILNATSDAGCDSDPHEVYVGIFPNAEITEVSGGGDICSDEDVVLNGTGMGDAASVDFTWISPSGDDVTVPPSMGVPVTGPFPGLDDTPEDGFYVLTITTPEGCTDTDSVEVNLGCTPLAEILFTDTTLCENDTLTICGRNVNPDCLGALDYTWLTPNGIPIVGSAMDTAVFCDEILPLSTYGSGTYYLFISSGGCTSLADSVEITLNPNPIISAITGGGTYCQGDTAIVCFEQLNPAVDSFFYTCNFPGGVQVTGIGVTGEQICFEITEENDFFNCSLESFDGCVSSLASTQVFFDSGFDLTVTSNSPVCSNDTLQLNGSNSEPCSGEVDYEWIDPDGNIVFTGTAPCAGPFPASVTDPISGDYCLVVLSQTTECNDTACVNVEVLPAPEVTVGINGGGDFCEGDTTMLTATVEKEGGGDIDFVWTLDGTPIVGASGTVASGDEVTLDLGTLDLDESGEYCLELTCPDNGCINIPPSCISVNVSPAPDITEITGAGTYCEGVDVELNGSGTPGPGDVTYVWEGPNFSFTDTAPCGGPYPATIPDIQQDQAGVYTLTVIKDECQVSESITINVNPTPIVSISLEPLICDGEETTITITIDPNNATSVDWELTGPNLMETGTVTELTTLTFDVTAMEGDVYTLTATSDQGCEAEAATAEVTTIPITPPTITATPNPLCPGEELTLTTTAQSGTDVSYCWLLDGNVIETTTEPVLVISNPQPGEYSVQAKVDGCDETSDPVSVTFFAGPDAVDDTYTGTADMDVNGNVTDNDTPNTGVIATVTNEPSNGTVTMNDDGIFTYTPNAGFAGTDEFMYEICLVECEELCDEATVTITINPTECVVPNVITPNGDGTNDVLFINCVPVNPNNSLRVFNRWGDEIFAAEPYNNDWDGESDGEPVPASTYFYLFYPDKNNKNDQLAGYIKVVR